MVVRFIVLLIYTLSLKTVKFGNTDFVVAFFHDYEEYRK